MAIKLGPNDPCACGSGKKVKKCCKLRRPSPDATAADRTLFFECLEAYASTVLEEDLAGAMFEIWEGFEGREGELDPFSTQVMLELMLMWFSFDIDLEDGVSPVEMMLRGNPPISAGARAFGERLRSTSLRPYEIVDIVPGVSVTLRDLVDGGHVTVAERTASRSMVRHEWVAARVVVPGISGKPEMERGVVSIPRYAHESVRAAIAGIREETRGEEDARRAFVEELGLFLIRTWLRCSLDPLVPSLANFDGEPLLPTRVHFEVHDRGAVERALAKSDAFESRGDHYSWTGTTNDGRAVTRGSLTFGDRTLTMETNSKERGDRALALLQGLAGDAIRHRATTHEDLERTIREQMKRRADGEAPVGATAQDAIPPHVAEALVLDHYAQHYRRWLDEPVPALDGNTPRQAAAKASTRGRVVELVQGLVGTYERALKCAEPAYDPSWMWAELGLDEQSQMLPPQLAHERLAQLVEGSADLVRDVVDSLRASRDESSLVSAAADIRDRLDVRRFLGAHRPASGSDHPAFRRRDLEPYVALSVEHAFHHRKVFWVDASLVLMLSHTDVDLVGHDLRAPFRTFALVFTDRYTLSLAERFLAREHRGSAVAGQILRVLTVYVTARGDEGLRALDLTFAFDALGDDLPELVEHRLEYGDATPVRSLFAPTDGVIVEGGTVDLATPLQQLLQLVVNAILYATSAGVVPEVRRAPTSAPKSRGRAARVFTSEEVYFLPGTIDIQNVRQIEALSRLGEGREALRRSMVRGHWRRAPKNWSDARPRWIAPYWKGPDMAALIERAYRLRA